ncbi:MAG: glycosyltransferase [Firmicutes bacterium]|nr:glycosyltransferase [Bacillota bacterium]
MDSLRRLPQRFASDFSWLLLWCDPIQWVGFLSATCSGDGGIPVVASRLGGLPEAIVDGKTGLLFEPGNAKDLAGRLAFLLDHPGLSQQYGLEGRKRCEAEFPEDRWTLRFLDAVRRRLQPE